MSEARTIHGLPDAAGLRVLLLAARFNAPIVDRLLSGALDALADRGADPGALTIARVPGAFELPLAARHAAVSARYDAIVALGVVIRGETAHFDYVAGECASGLARVMDDTAVPIGFGVLTVDNVDQALARAGGARGNKGADAALAALEMCSVLRQLDAGSG